MTNAEMTERGAAPKTLGEVRTLVDMLAFRAASTPEGEAFVWRDKPTTYAEMWTEIERVAAFLMSIGVEPGDRVVIVFPNGDEFFSAFYGPQLAGAVAAPVFPGSGVRRILSILQSAGAKVVIVPSDTDAAKLDEYRAVFEQFGAKIYRHDECRAPSGEKPVFPRPEAEDLAFLQYTSGSTGDSKGVMLSHANLIANVRQVVDQGAMVPEDVVVTWLPLYHDLGLILMTMVPFYLGARLIILPTTLSRMNTWVEAIAKYKGTFTAAPDVGYRMLVRQVRHPEEYDLSSLRTAINAAEPVREKTVREFEKMFKLGPITKPSYGLAEASVAVTYWSNDPRPIKVDAKGFLGVGKALPRVELKIVVDDRVAAVGEVGDLLFKSPAATRGYFRNPEATDALFWRDGFLRSGDLAYFDEEGDLFIVARKKNVIKHSGRSIAPREVEELVEDLPHIRCCAAVGVDRKDDAGEQLYVFAESHVNSQTVATEGAVLVRQIVQAIHSRLGIRPGRVYIVKKRTVPYTYNGKIQHVELRNRYQSGALAAEGLLLYPTYSARVV